MKSDEHDAAHDPESPSVEIRVIGGTASPGWNVPKEAEEVIRLEKTLPEIRNSVDDVGPALPEAPRRRRGRKRRITQRQLTFAMAGGVALLTILAVLGLRFRNDAAPGEQVPYGNVGVDRGVEWNVEPTSLGRLSENAQDYLVKAQEKVRRYLAAEQVADVLPLIRDRARWKALLEEQWQPLRMENEKVDHLQMEFDEHRGSAWFTLNGEDDEGQRVQLVFVPNGEDVDMDWAASFGVGDMPFGHLDRLVVGDEVDMRVIVDSDNYFTRGFPEGDYLCFKLETRFQEDWVWGYAPVGSPIASELVGLLRQDSNILDAREGVRAILTMSKNERCGRRQFEIRQLVAERWVDMNERE